jgi:hypothetical protein
MNQAIQPTKAETAPHVPDGGELVRCGVQLIYQGFELDRQLRELRFQERALKRRLIWPTLPAHERQELQWQVEMLAGQQADLVRRREELTRFSGNVLQRIDRDALAMAS